MQDLLKDYVIEDLVVMYQSTKQDVVLEEIVKRNEGLIYSWARDYKNIPNYAEEDLVEEAVIACWKAVSNFNPDKGIRFSSFLKGCVTQCFNRIYQQETRVKRYNGTELESYEAITEHNDTGCANFTKCHMDDYSSLEINEFLMMLDGTTKQVAELLLTGFSKVEVSGELHISPASTSYHVKRIKNSYTNYKACIAG